MKMLFVWRRRQTSCEGSASGGFWGATVRFRSHGSSSSRTFGSQQSATTTRLFVAIFQSTTNSKSGGSFVCQHASDSVGSTRCVHCTVTNVED